ncbi:MAG: hypothetical protein ACYSUL_06465 [Planctomycetota bacterium]|jgi:hypothetical protein
MYKFNLLRISVLVSIVLLLCMTASFGQEQKDSKRQTLADLIRQSMMKKGGGENAQRQGAETEEEEEGLDEFDDEFAAETEPIDPNKPVDPFAGVERGGKSEMREWIYGQQEDRLALSRRVQSQITEELNYIRKAAEAEGSTQTLAAIDKVIANRKERFDRIAKRIREERAKATKTQGVNPRQNVRGRGATGTGRGATRGQQEPGPRGRMYQGGQGQQPTRGRQNGY